MLDELKDIFSGMNQTVIVEDLHQRQRTCESRNSANKQYRRMDRYLTAATSDLINVYGRVPVVVSICMIEARSLLESCPRTECSWPLACLIMWLLVGSSMT